MRNFLRVLVPVAAATALALGVVMPAEAATTGDTATTFTITAGALAITVPSTANLGTYAASITTLAASGQLGTVQVDDNRGLLAAWTTTASSTDFVGPNYTVPKAQVSYLAGTVNKTNITSVTVPGLTALGAPLPVVTTATLLGSNSATWNPTLTVAFPLSAIAGTYNGTVTHSVA